MIFTWHDFQDYSVDYAIEEQEELHFSLVHFAISFGKLFNSHFNRCCLRLASLYSSPEAQKNPKSFVLHSTTFEFYQLKIVCDAVGKSFPWAFVYWCLKISLKWKVDQIQWQTLDSFVGMWCDLFFETNLLLQLFNCWHNKLKILRFCLFPIKIWTCSISFIRNDFLALFSSFSIPHKFNIQSIPIDRSPETRWIFIDDNERRNKRQINQYRQTMKLNFREILSLGHAKSRNKQRIERMRTRK